MRRALLRSQLTIFSSALVPGSLWRSTSRVIARSEPYRSSRNARRASACQRLPRSSPLIDVSIESMLRWSPSV